MNKEEIKALIRELEVRKERDAQFFDNFTDLYNEGFMDGLMIAADEKVRLLPWLEEQLEDIRK